MSSFTFELELHKALRRGRSLMRLKKLLLVAEMRVNEAKLIGWVALEQSWTAEVHKLERLIDEAKGSDDVGATVDDGHGRGPGDVG